MTDRRLALLGLAAGIAGYCVTTSASGHHAEFVRTVLAVAIGTVLAAVLTATSRHAHAARHLRRHSHPTKLAGVSARVGTFAQGAFVAGILRPTIYCDRELAARLPEEQIRAVMLHELAHQQARDPLRLVLLDVAGPILRPFRTGRSWLTWVTAQHEIRADHHALDHGVSRTHIAAALLATGNIPQPHVAGFTSAIDLRLKALLGEPAEPDVDPRIFAAAILLTAAGVGTALCAWLLHPHLQAAARTIL